MADFVRVSKKFERKLTERLISGELDVREARLMYAAKSYEKETKQAEKKAEKKARKALKAAKKRVSPKVIKKAQTVFDEARNRESVESWELEDALRVPIPAEFAGKAASLKKPKQQRPTCPGHSSSAFTCEFCVGKVQKSVKSGVSLRQKDDLWESKNADNPADRERAFARLFPDDGFARSTPANAPALSPTAEKTARIMQALGRRSENPAEREAYRNAAEDIRVNGAPAVHSSALYVPEGDRSRLNSGSSSPYVQ